MLFISSFTTSCARFTKFYPRNVILFQIKVKATNIKETTLARHFMKVTSGPSFRRLRVTKVYFRCRAESRRAENISARLGSAWHASVLDEENIAVLKQLY